tara:strand:+ start:260 stop:697 length:438 start_codon:yes stop_codon:yes gene_type:complete
MAQILLVVCALSCCSSSSSAAAFFSGLIPRTEPHFLKVTGIGEFKNHSPFLNDVVKKRTDALKTTIEIESEMDKISESNPNDVKAFCVTADKFKAARTTPPYNQPGDILTIGGMKNPAVVGQNAFDSAGVPRTLMAFAARGFCEK